MVIEEQSQRSVKGTLLLLIFPWGVFGQKNEYWWSSGHVLTQLCLELDLITPLLKYQLEN